MSRKLYPLLWRYAACAIIAGAAFGRVEGQDFLIGPPPVRSHSGQFIVHAQPDVSHPMSVTANLATNRSLLKLDPALVAVSCERIKQNLFRELGVTSPWRGQIYVQVRRSTVPAENIVITSQMFKGQWQYRLELPDPVNRVRYVRAVVQALLLELANRDSQGRLSEVPLWLTEGLARQILASNELEIMLSPPRDSVNGVSVTRRAIERQDDPLKDARLKVGARAPLSFEELSWPAAGAASADPTDLYSLSSQIFVGELLRLIDGKACLRSMLTQMPQFYNWQFAFLRAFQSYFQRPLDVEKWWALTIASSSGRETAKLWPAEESWRKLDETLPTVLDIRNGTNAPIHESWTPQAIIREWPLDRQAHALQDKLLELETLRAHSAQDVVMLVQDYCQALTIYLRNEHKSAPITSIGKPSGLSQIARQTIERLDALDGRRRALRPPLTPVADGNVQRLSSPGP